MLNSFLNANTHCHGISRRPSLASPSAIGFQSIFFPFGNRACSVLNNSAARVIELAGGRPAGLATVAALVREDRALGV